MKDRLNEELIMVNDEMGRLVAFKLNEISLILKEPDGIPVTTFGIGLKSLLLQKTVSYKTYLSKLQKLWGKFF